MNQKTIVLALSVLFLGSLFAQAKITIKVIVPHITDGVYLTGNQEERFSELMIQDKTNKETATDPFFSLSTVKTHIRNIYAKLEVSNRQEFF